MPNPDLEKKLEELPDLVADALSKWRIATLDRERKEALLYARFRGENPDSSSTEIKALIAADMERYTLVIAEIHAETDYNRLYERLMSVKKIASLRTAF